jgi:putative addiction module component (TIGR02574 family)
MIAERIPAIASLSLPDKWRLATELFDEVEQRGDAFPVDDAILAGIEARFSRYQSGQETASPWPEVKARILAARQ